MSTTIDLTMEEQHVLAGYWHWKKAESFKDSELTQTNVFDLVDDATIESILSRLADAVTRGWTYE